MLQLLLGKVCMCQKELNRFSEKIRGPLLSLRYTHSWWRKNSVNRYCSSTHTQKSQPHYSRKQQHFGQNCPKLIVNTHKTESRGLCTNSPQTIYRKFYFMSRPLCKPWNDQNLRDKPIRKYLALNNK